MRFQCCDCRGRHKGEKAAHKQASKNKTADAPAIEKDILQLPKQDPVDSEAQLPKEPAWNQRIVPYDTPPDERTDANSANSTYDDDSETESSSASESSEKTPSVKSKQQHVERAKFLQRMFADIEEGGCQESVSSG